MTTQYITIIIIDERKGNIKMFDRNENKKTKKARNAQKRIMVTFNTGTRTFKSEKDYSREKGKKICRDFLKNY